MVLADLGRKLNGALQSLNAQSAIDARALDSLLKTLCTALLEADVNVRLVASLRERVKAKTLPQLEDLHKKSGDQAVAARGKQIVQKAVIDELTALVDPGDNTNVENFKPKKGSTNVIMFVGLQGAGKTTSCTKLAVHYQRRGLKTALVCADTFRAGAFDQLKQNATKAKIPFFGSYTETDPAVIAAQGVARFRAERFDVIIVDTSGRHRQEAALFDEMRDIAGAVEPNLTIMVLDGAIGQAAESQSRAFKDAAGFGAIIVTKLDGHAKGGGAISAVAATKTPIIFIGTGEHLHDLERFSPRPFISKLLGMGDIQGLMDKAEEMAIANPDRQENLMKKFEKGEFTIRDMKEQLSMVMSMGPLGKLASMVPGMSQMLGGNEAEASMRMRRMVCIFDSMTQAELDSDGSPFVSRPPKKIVAAQKESSSGSKEGSSKDGGGNGNGKAPPVRQWPENAPRAPNKRILRVARGSGTSVREVEELLAQHRMFMAMVKKAGGKSGWMAKMKQMQGGGGAGARGGMPPMGPGGMPDLSKLTPRQMQQMQSMMPASVRQQMQQPGAMEAAMEMMRNMGGGGGPGGGMPDLSKLMGGMGMRR